MRPANLTGLILLAGVLLPAEADAFGGWHDLFRFGGFQRTRADVWDDLCEEVYDEGRLDDLWDDPHNLFQFGCGRYGCTGCTAPLHYRQFAPATFPQRSGHYPGSSWYRGNLHVPSPTITQPSVSTSQSKLRDAPAVYNHRQP